MANQTEMHQVNIATQRFYKFSLNFSNIGYVSTELVLMEEKKVHSGYSIKEREVHQTVKLFLTQNYL